MENSQNEVQTQIEPHIEPQIPQRHLILTSQNVMSTLQKELQLKFYDARQKFAVMCPTERPQIPKIRNSLHNNTIVNEMNNVLEKQWEQNIQSKFETLHTYVYCGAVAVIWQLGMKLRETTDDTVRGVRKKPKWEQRLVARIESLRRDLGRLTQ